MALPPRLRTSTPTSVARCCAVTTMPLSAATGLSDAALAAGPTANVQRQAIKISAVGDLLNNHIGQLFKSLLERRKAIKILSPRRIASPGSLERLLNLEPIFKVLMPKLALEADPDVGEKPCLVAPAGQVVCRTTIVFVQPVRRAPNMAFSDREASRLASFGVQN